MNNQPHKNNPYINNNSKNSPQTSFIIGALIGATATYILSNKNAQKAIFRGFTKLSSIFEAGIEELKERYEDTKAELEAEQ